MDTSQFVPTIDVRQRIQSDVIRLLARQLQIASTSENYPFGSYAYGQPRPESDIDLLII